MLSHLSAHAPELRQQGAEEAARDPNSNVTSEDAEQFMVEQTKKAGVPAYQFDPYASPEEKAAQARSVSEPSVYVPELALLKTIIPACAGGPSPREKTKRCCNRHRHCESPTAPVPNSYTTHPRPLG